ncbi:MAG: TA system VapC family ribonuclease toxin [Chloroflexota bacterium]
MNEYLLDVNVLIAMSDPAHVHHEAAQRWFSVAGAQAWATCPMTENGFTRIISHPRYPNCPGDASVVLGMLRRFCNQPGHAFWPDDVSLRDALVDKVLMTHGQVTDLYLLALAARHGGKLATFDRRITASPIPGASDAILLIPS